MSPQEHAEDVLLDVQGLEVEVLTGDGWATVVDGVSFSLRRGETLGLVGESGSGKSVTCLSIAQLMPRRQTRIRAERLTLGGENIAGLDERAMSAFRGERIAMIFQEPMSSLNPAFTVGDQIGEPLRRHRGLSRKQARREAIELLRRVGVPVPERRVDQYPFEFSGGMRQRVMIAMALSCDPEVLIADEPTTALDVTVQAQILDLIKSIQEERGISVIFITHDLGVVADICDRVMVMYAGQIVEGAEVHRVFEEPQHPYQEGLIAAMPRLDNKGELRSIPGSPPRIGRFPQGCRFHPRCPYAVEACKEGTIPLLEVHPEHTSRCIRADELILEGTS
ncbi:ABC transporter ATP-binding protein [Ornithinimicrobium sufpigmenti]|uniref:ABC transporter ATP-binding protein n=1 Tax=Ornithinimicrobium sufpigmenti TaxID=2508882 RepID=UPI001035D96C|nr:MULTISPECIES: ABC transporter ATP-binding protein [unclassified Ornithinimicrobium]